MNALNVNNFRFVKNKEGYTYVVEIKDNKYILKRILNNNEIVIISIFNEFVEFKYIKNNKVVNNLNVYEKDNIVNDIVSTLSCNNLVNFINFNNISKLIKDTYINIVCSNNLIGLSVLDNNIINVILLESNTIIGSIKIDYDVKVKVDSNYYEQVLSLMKQYLNSKNNKCLKYIKG